MAAGCTKPVLYYTFENGTGTAVTDRSNAGNNLDVSGFVGTPDWDNTNKIRGSYSMNFTTCESVGNGKPTPDAGSIGDLTTFNYMHDGSPWTVSTWLRMTTSGYNAICGNTASSQAGRMIMYNGGIRVYGASGDVNPFAGSTLTLDTWTHVLVTCAGAGAGNLQLWLDGVQTGGNQTGGVATAGNAGNTWAVGALGNSSGVWCSNGWQGQIDEFSMWDVAFDPGDVAAIYGDGTPPDVSNGLDRCPTEVGRIGGFNERAIKSFNGIPAYNIKSVSGTDAATCWPPKRGWTSTKSIDLDGGDQDDSERLALATHSDFDFEYTDAFSLSAWFKTSMSIGFSSIISKTAPVSVPAWGNIKGWAINWISSRPQFWISNAYQTNSLQAFPSGSTFADGDWHNVVCVKPAGAGPFYFDDVEIWVDGVSQVLDYYHDNPGLSATIVTTGDVKVGGNPFGNYASGKGFDGGIAEVGVWDTALSSGSIADIYNSGVPTNLSNHAAAANLVSYWRMGNGCESPIGSDGMGCDDQNACTGLLDNMDSSDSDARIYDMSANSHNMTPTNTEEDDIVEDAP